MMIGDRMDRAGHFGGSLLLFFGILYIISPSIGSMESLLISVAAAGMAAAMSVKQDEDRKVLWGIFHRTWITHSLSTVIMATIAAYTLFYSLLKLGSISYYFTIAVFSATLSHVLLDSMTKMGVPLFGPFDNTMRGPKWFRGSSLFINYTFLAAGILMAMFYYGLIKI
jgi:inner membrane protein